MKINLLVKFPDQNTEQTIDSLKPLGIVTKPVRIKTKDFSAARNKLIDQDDWNLYLDPGEILHSGHDEILEAIKGPPCAYHLKVVQDTAITKEVRLWHGATGLAFENPVCESLVDPQSKELDAIILGSPESHVEEKLQLIEKWKTSRPADHNPYYYEACLTLGLGRYQQFMRMANHYLFLNKDGMSVILIHYYCAVIQLYVMKNAELSIKYLLPCLASRPTMAEFWCLLGDNYYSLNQYQRAQTFYENAILLGSRRIDDKWPIEVDKYKKYPEKMQANCQGILDNTRYFGVKK